ncbi:CSC1-like protein 1 [Oppia nitens]|uniref:CSC1-like protein 1 n=1 Tax=Oppia nitens TaxID=1686743 RepID=UPI0023DB6AA3|nr:CSC1-like protein 1 [Oppia nitens]
MSVIFHTILTLIFLFLSTPSIAVNILMSPFGSEDMPVLVGLRQFGQPYLLMAMTSILPSLISLVQNQISYKTKSSLSHALMFKSYFFLILMVLILPALGLYTSAVLLDMLFSGENTSSKQQIQWNCMFPSGNSAFFMNYVLSSALVSNSLQILLVPEAAQYALYLLVLSRSVAEYESARLKIHFDFSFGSRYPILLLIFTVVTTYSISSPLIAPVGLFANQTSGRSLQSILCLQSVAHNRQNASDGPIFCTNSLFLYVLSSGNNIIAIQSDISVVRASDTRRYLCF